jgi:NAD(P)H-hydrate epimerase
MRQADRFAIQTGRCGADLMDAAGGGLFHEIQARWAKRPTAVLCGPGDNGGDGWEAAARLHAAGWPIEVFTQLDPAELTGDAARAAAKWRGRVSRLEDCEPARFALVIDALFGAGLSRPLEGQAARLAEACRTARETGLTVVSADIPSGVDGDRARAEGPAFQADLTVTFHRLKPAHLLQPARTACGEIALVDIGIPEGWAKAAPPCAQINGPSLWDGLGLDPPSDAHKHTRGRLCVLTGPAGASGAARLAGQGGLIAGAGFVTLLCPPDALSECAGATRSLVTRGFDPDADFGAVLGEHRAGAVVLGPGAGLGDLMRRRVLAALKHGAPLVLDADALSAFEHQGDTLFAAIKGPAVLTPHGGEFARLFPDLAQRGDLNKIERTRQAAVRANAVVVFKGPDTVIAGPDGRVRVNVHANARLATAGTGDVLAGLIGAFLAQGEDLFDAASAAVWIHGEAGRRCGPGASVETVLATLPDALSGLRDRRQSRAALRRISAARS